MKKALLIAPGFILIALVLFIACSKNDPAEPCDNTGRICITNKLDSVASVQIVQLNQLYNLEKDFMQCLVLKGNSPYTFKVTCNTYHLDTTFLIQDCDDLQLILE